MYKQRCVNGTDSGWCCWRFRLAVRLRPSSSSSAAVVSLPPRLPAFLPPLGPARILHSSESDCSMQQDTKAVDTPTMTSTMTSIRTATQLELVNLIQYLSVMISAATTPATMMMDSARSAISSTITRASATSHSLLAGYLAASTNPESGSTAANASSVPDACLPIIRAALESLASCVRAADHDHSDPTHHAPLSPYLTLAAVSLAYLDSASTASGVPAFAHAHASLAALVNVCSASTECVNPAPATRSVLDSLIAALGSELVSRVLSLPEYDSEDIRDKLDSAWSSRVGSPEPVEQVEQLMETVADEAVAVKAALPASDVEDNDEE